MAERYKDFYIKHSRDGFINVKGIPIRLLGFRCFIHRPFVGRSSRISHYGWKVSLVENGFSLMQTNIATTQKEAVWIAEHKMRDYGIEYIEDMMGTLEQAPTPRGSGDRESEE